MTTDKQSHELSKMNKTWWVMLEKQGQTRELSHIERPEIGKGRVCRYRDILNLMHVHADVLIRLCTQDEWSHIWHNLYILQYNIVMADALSSVLNINPTNLTIFGEYFDINLWIHSYYVFIHLFIYIYIYMCVCIYHKELVPTPNRLIF